MLDLRWLCIVLSRMPDNDACFKNFAHAHTKMKVLQKFYDMSKTKLTADFLTFPLVNFSKTLQIRANLTLPFT